LAADQVTAMFCSFSFELLLRNHVSKVLIITMQTD
jgi:hypothetical protein